MSTNEISDDDLLVGAPEFSPHVNVGLVAAITAANILSMVVIAKGQGIADALGIAIAVIAFFIVVAINVKVSEKLESSYIAELLRKARIASTQENINRASKVFKTRKSISSSQTIMLLLSWVALTSFSIWQLSGLFQFRFVSFVSLFSLLWEICIIFFCIFLGLIFSMSYGLVDRYEPISFSPSSSAQSSTLSLGIEDRNDIDIAGLAVALQAVMRRADSYTIESTLLSGLSFSAFIGIAFSDKGPIENYTWLTRSINSIECNIVSAETLGSCLLQIYPMFSEHVMFWVAALMLVCAMLFMAAIIVRFQFNEAYRHTEEILAVARVLNEKEGDSTPEKRQPITQEITQLLEKGKAGFRDMSPLSSAMRSFRNLGVAAFTCAVAICGMYFHIYIFVSLLVIISCAYCFTYVDNFRRKATFLRQLETGVTSVFHKRV